MTAKRPIIGGVVLGLLALLVMLGGTDTASAGTFNPSLTVKLASTEPETPSDFTVDFGLEFGDVNFAGVVSFIPKEWGIVKGDAIPVGTKVGSLSALATLGLINGPCSTQLPVDFTFLNATVDRSETVSFDDLELDDPSLEGYGTRDFAEDKNGDGLLDAIDKYPEFLDRVFGDIQPIRRSAGITPVAGVAVLLQFIIYPPGTEFDLPGEALDELIPEDEELGYPTVVALQNIGDPQIVPEPGPITDFCTPLTSTNITLSLAEDNPDTTEDDSYTGEQLFVNPQDGKYTFTVFSVGQRDADNDGIQNSMDTCVFEANVGDPSLPGDGDVDLDGLDAACDPDDSKIISDEDLDGYLNRGDNCPLEPNGQEQTEPATGNQKDEDLDQVGDACDPDATVADGELLEGLREAEVTVGAGTGPPGPPSEASCPDCYRLGGEEPEETEPPDEVVDEGGDDDGGSNTGLIIGIIAAVAAGVVVLGGGAYLLMRRG